MRAVIQRVSKCVVTVNGQNTGVIDHGLLILLGIENEDNEEDAEWLANKIVQMRIFSDNEDKMHLSVIDIGGKILVVSQFTLFASTKKGNRPSFIKSAGKEKAVPLYEYFLNYIEKIMGVKPETGIFGAMMQVDLVNDGPVTIIMDTKNKE